jgi:hypothetical protein
MPDIEPVKKLKRLFEAHDISCTVEDQWVVPNNALPAIRALWYPQETNGRLDIQVLLKGGVFIEECFAGVGDNNKAFSDAFQNFMINSFHVLLAALWDKNDPERIAFIRRAAMVEQSVIFIAADKRYSLALTLPEEPNVF